ncbi:ceramide kinase-like isoform X1 [Magallana gigas]|uniref:ceramide kinase-like isoform X1 n=1 Tax=Magallana gigas TaxID=29159 RepID=UPI00334299D8
MSIMVHTVGVESLILEEERLKLSNKSICDINISDVIGCHLTEEPAGLLSGLFWSSPNLVVRYISKGKNYKWTAETVQVTGSKEECEALQDKINEKLGQEKNRPKRLAVFINPVGGRRNALKTYSDAVHPLFKVANINCDVNVSERPKHLIDLVNSYDTSNVDGLVILGGDGSLLEVLNCLVIRAQREVGLDYDQPTCKLKPLEVPIGIIPTGTGNGTAKCLYGNMDVVTAALHVIKGKTNHNNIQAVYSGGRLVSFSTIFIAYGFFTDMMYEMERQTWLERTRFLVIPLYNIFLKKPRLFNVKLSILKGKQSDDKDSMSEGKEIAELSSLMSLCSDFFNNASNSKVDLVDMSQKTRKSGVFTLLALKETGRLQFISCFLQLLTLNRSIFQKDCVSSYSVKGYRVKILSQQSDNDSRVARINNLLDVDGERVDLVGGEYEVRNHLRLVKFYTSY